MIGLHNGTRSEFFTPPSRINLNEGTYLPQGILFERPNDLFIHFNYFYEQTKNLSNKWFITLIDYIAEKYNQVDCIHFMPGDVPNMTPMDLEQTPDLKQLHEFVFYKKLKKRIPHKNIKGYYFQQDADTNLPYADPNLYQWLEYFEICNNQMYYNFNHSRAIRYNPQPNLDKVNYKLVCLNNAPRHERSYLSVLMSNFDILLTHKSPFYKRLPFPKFLDTNIIEKYKENFSTVKKQFRINNHESEPDNRKFIVESFDLIQKGVCNIVTEDPFWRDGARITEKTVKPIFIFRPFILVAASGTLNWLKSQGFKTFSHWWDESYDQETDNWRRLEAVYKQAEYINSLSLSDCKQLLIEMEPVLQHNNFHLINSFAKSTLSNLLA